MKKILFSAIALVMLTACGGGDRQMYFDSNASRIYNDPNAEFDTLSYAVGMNVGLSLKLQNGDFELINDLIMETLEEELNKTEVDYDAVNANSRMMSRFSSERSRPYAMAKRMNAFVQTDRPDTLTLPELYNEEFTREGMSECIGDIKVNLTRPFGKLRIITEDMKAVGDLYVSPDYAIVEYQGVPVYSFNALDGPAKIVYSCGWDTSPVR